MHNYKKKIILKYEHFANHVKTINDLDGKINIFPWKTKF